MLKNECECIEKWKSQCLVHFVDQKYPLKLTKEIRTGRIAGWLDGNVKVIKRTLAYHHLVKNILNEENDQNFFFTSKSISIWPPHVTMHWQELSMKSVLEHLKPIIWKGGFIKQRAILEAWYEVGRRMTSHPSRLGLNTDIAARLNVSHTNLASPFLPLYSL